MVADGRGVGASQVGGKEEGGREGGRKRERVGCTRAIG